MTANPACIKVDKPLHELTTLMRQHHVRRVPIVDDQYKPMGIVTLDDVLSLLSDEMSDMRQTVTKAFFRGWPGDQSSFSSPQDYWWSAAMPAPPQSEEESPRGQATVDALYRRLAEQKLSDWSLLCDSL
jgi:hypothetical protein